MNSVDINNVSPDEISPKIIAALNARGIKRIRDIRLVVTYFDHAEAPQETPIDPSKLKKIPKRKISELGSESVKKSKEDSPAIVHLLGETKGPEIPEGYIEALSRLKDKNDTSKLTGRQVFFNKDGELLDDYVTGAFSTILEKPSSPFMGLSLRVSDDDLDEIRKHSSSFVESSFSSSLSGPVEVIPAVENVFFRFTQLRWNLKPFDRNSLLVTFASLVPVTYTSKLIRPMPGPPIE